MHDDYQTPTPTPAAKRLTLTTPNGAHVILDADAVAGVAESTFDSVVIYLRGGQTVTVSGTVTSIYSRIDT